MNPQDVQNQPPQVAAPNPYSPAVPPSQPAPQFNPNAPTAAQESEKSYVIAVLLSFFLGQFGIDRFYLGKIGTGVAKLLTLGGFGIWFLIDLILIVIGTLRAKDGLPLQGYAQNNKLFKIIFFVLIGIELLVAIGIMILLAVTTSSGIQEKAQSSKQQADIPLLQTQVEAYYHQAGHYPSLTDLNSATWRRTNMASLDATALKDPANTTCDNLAAAGNCLVALPTAKSYAYAVADKKGSPCESDDKQCVAYTLTATFPSPVNGASTYAKTNLN